MRIRPISSELLQTIDGLYRYGAAPAMDFLHRWLMMIRTQICRGFIVLVPDHEETVLTDLPEFYTWVHKRYPAVDTDQLRKHPERQGTPYSVEWADWNQTLAGERLSARRRKSCESLYN